MAFFEKMSGALAAKSKDVADKAKEVAEVGRLNGQINGQKNAIEKLYLEIGKMIYANREDWSSADLTGQLEQLDFAQAEVARLQQEILRVKGLRRCESCGAEVDVTMAFCPKCGAAKPEDVPGEDAQEEREERQAQEEQAENFCPGCHQKVEQGAMFCPFCGVRLQ